MTSPCYLEAVHDRSMVGTIALSVYLELYHRVLDPVQFRPVKQFALARELGVSLRSIEEAMATLIQRGYLERGPVKPTEVRTYRLVHSRMP